MSRVGSRLQYAVTVGFASVTTSALGIVPDAPGVNDFSQTYQPSLAKAQDTASQINDALSSNQALVFDQPGTYYIGSSILVLKSNRSIIATVPGVVLKMHSSMLDYLMLVGQMTDYTSGGRNLGVPTFNANTVSNTYIEGIEFQRSAQGGTGGPGPANGAGPGGWAGHTIWASNFRNLNFQNCQFTGYDTSGRIRGGKYAVLVNNGIGLYCDGIKFNNPSDGIHIQGPFYDAVLSKLSGYCGDNMTAIVPGDDYQIETTYGSVRRVHISDINLDVARQPDGTATTVWNGSSYTTPAGSVQPFRIDGHDAYWVSGTTYTSAGYEASDVWVDNVHGPLATGNSTCALLDGVRGDSHHTGASGLPMHRIRFSNIGTINGSNTAQVQVDTAYAYEVAVDNVDVNTAGYVFWATSKAAGNLRLRISNARSLVAPSGDHMFVFDGAAALVELYHVDMAVAASANTCFLRLSASTAQIARLIAEDVNVDLSAGSATRFMWNSDGAVIDGRMARVTCKGAQFGFLCNDTSGTNRSFFQISDLYLPSGPGANAFVKGRCDLRVTGYRSVGSGPLVDFSGTGHPTFYMTPQWNEFVVGQNWTPKDASVGTFNDFGTSASTNSGTLNINSITRFANAAGIGLGARGTFITEVVARPLQSFTFSSGTLGTIKLNLGTTVASTQYLTGTVDLAAVSTTTHEHAVVAAASAYANENFDYSLAMTLINSGTGQWANCTAGRLSIRILWCIQATGT